MALLPSAYTGASSASSRRALPSAIANSGSLVLTTRAARDAAAQSDSLELELVGDAGHFIVDERPELVADRLLRLLPR